MDAPTLSASPHRWIQAKDLHAIAYARSATRFIVNSAGRALLGSQHDVGL